MSKSPLHSLICTLLYKLLLAQVPKSYSVWKEEPLTLADSEPEPDISVTHGTEMEFKSGHPVTAELVIELALSSAALDRENASLYAEAQVTEYWILLAPTRQVEAYRNPVNGRYQTKTTFAPGQTIECAGVPGVRIAVSDIFAPAA
jgi:Uma2 family endonuclease